MPEDESLDAPVFALAGTLPVGEDFGFYGILSEIHKGAATGTRFVTVTVWDVAKTNIHRRKGNVRTEVLAVVSVEPVFGPDAEQAMAMHDRMRGERTGSVTLGEASGQPPGPAEIPGGSAK